MSDFPGNVGILGAKVISRVIAVPRFALVPRVLASVTKTGVVRRSSLLILT